MGRGGRSANRSGEPRRGSDLTVGGDEPLDARLTSDSNACGYPQAVRLWSAVDVVNGIRVPRLKGRNIGRSEAGCKPVDKFSAQMGRAGASERMRA